MQGKFARAIDRCYLALKYQPNFAPAYLTIGNAWHAQNDLEKAIQAYSQALRIQPDFAEASANLGSMYYKLGQLDSAANCYQKALDINPSLRAVQLMLGSVLQQQGKLDAAIVCYQKVLEMQPKDPATAEKLANLLQEKDRQTASENFIELETESGAQQAISVNKDEGYGLQPSSINLPPVKTTENLDTTFTNPEEISEPVAPLNLPDSAPTANFQAVEQYKILAENCLVKGKIKEAIAPASKP